MKHARTAAILAVLAVVLPLGGTVSSGEVDRHTSTRASVALAPAPAKIRVDQLGYLPHEVKRARLMTARQVDHATYAVVNSHGDPVLHGRVPDRRIDLWNGHYRAVYLLSFSRLTTPGRYRLQVAGDVTASSPSFRVGSASALYGTLLRYGVRFDQVQRDGRAVLPGPLRRKPAHLHDRRAFVYGRPSFVPGSDTVTDPDLERVGGPVDVAGGWYDAGDYLKFTHSTAYNDILLFRSAQLVHGGSRQTLLREARHGLTWLGRMWNARTRTLYMQVGIGSGNRKGHLPRRSRLVAASAARRPRLPASGPLRLPPPGLPGRPTRRADQPEPRRAGLGPRSPSLPRQMRRPIRRGRDVSSARRPCCMAERARVIRRSSSSQHSRTRSTRRTAGTTTWSWEPPRSRWRLVGSAVPHGRTSSTQPSGRAGTSEARRVTRSISTTPARWRTSRWSRRSTGPARPVSRSGALPWSATCTGS